MKVICPGWFGVKHDQPVRLDDKPGTGTGHGMCPACTVEANKQIDELEKAKGAPK